MARINITAWENSTFNAIALSLYISAYEYDFHSFSGTAFSDTPPNTPCGASDYGYFAFKIFHNEYL